MGSRDDAELCEAIDYYLLSKIKECEDLKDTIIGLCRDDLIAAVPRKGNSINRTVTILTKLLSEEGLKLVEWEEADEMKYLDVCMNINDGSFKQFR